MSFRNTRRRILSNVMTGLCALAVLLALVPLAMILFFVVAKGAGSLNWAFFTEIPKPVGETGGGMSNAIAGSLIMCGLGALFAIPVGVISGIYIVESRSRFAPFVRFAADALNGVPSIVIGLFVYVVAVVPFKQFSALAGGLGARHHDDSADHENDGGVAAARPRQSSRGRAGPGRHAQPGRVQRRPARRASRHRHRRRPGPGAHRW
jgi:ABC-type phosphate transport system permease subunit